MKNRIGLVVLTLACIALLIALIVTNKSASTQRQTDRNTIDTFSNQVVSVQMNLTEQKQVNAELEKNLASQKQSYLDLTNTYVQAAGSLEKTAESLKAAQAEIAARDTKIAELESQNQSLDDAAAKLSASITNLNVQIAETKQKLASSEGEKSFLQQELNRLMAEKADLEKKFNDLAFLRAQVAKLREELTISRRLDWIRRGIFSDQKGAQRLQTVNNTPTFSSGNTSSPTTSPEHYDLNVEVHSDGTVHVIPPPTNNPSPGQ